MAVDLSDPVAASLLDFVSIEESDGNYNAFIGHARSTDDLSLNTINGIYAFQRKLISWGEPSSAVGRYQCIQRTLSVAVQTLSIGLTAKFTPLIQDKVGRYLLGIRGYNLWLAKNISDEEFAHRISCEWASLPDPYNDNKSHYDGVGPNHAGQTIEAVYAAFAKARALEPPMKAQEGSLVSLSQEGV